MLTDCLPRRGKQTDRHIQEEKMVFLSNDSFGFSCAAGGKNAGVPDGR